MDEKSALELLDRWRTWWMTTAPQRDPVVEMAGVELHRQTEELLGKPVKQVQS